MPPASPPPHRQRQGPCMPATSPLTLASSQPTPAAAHGPRRCSHSPHPSRRHRLRTGHVTSHTPRLAVSHTPRPSGRQQPRTRRATAHTPLIQPDAIGCARATSLLTHTASLRHTRPVQADASRRAWATALLTRATSHPPRTGDVAANAARHVSASARTRCLSQIVTPSYVASHSQRQQARTGHVTHRTALSSPRTCHAAATSPVTRCVQRLPHYTSPHLTCALWQPARRAPTTAPATSPPDDWPISPPGVTTIGSVWPPPVRIWMPRDSGGLGMTVCVGLMGKPYKNQDDKVVRCPHRSTHLT
ncbi:hypothetical protein BKA70DRAFT_1451316 [Coprinopsis sp. MPI-PUGE-AT-0042]|nr:hypothetical protein BKA70DRAFT_1451316 [Coprinopsis sp. MPI-PUGE-AT-0042]